MVLFHICNKNKSEIQKLQLKTQNYGLKVLFGRILSEKIRKFNNS